MRIHMHVHMPHTHMHMYMRMHMHTCTWHIQHAGVGYGKEVDLWSCGVIMYVLLAGKLPFDGADAHSVIQKTIRAQLEFEPAAGK